MKIEEIKQDNQTLARENKSIYKKQETEQTDRKERTRQTT